MFTAVGRTVDLGAALVATPGPLERPFSTRSGHSPPGIGWPVVACLRPSITTGNDGKKKTRDDRIYDPSNIAASALSNQNPIFISRYKPTATARFERASSIRPILT